MAPVSITVNGRTHNSDVEPRTLLVHYLRDTLGLTGTHIGCDTSQCGACVVHVNGASIKSCTMLAIQCDGAQITTIEGLAQPGDLHPMQEGFWERHGLQCGFCTPGMIMAATDLIQRNPNPSESEIRHGLEGNLCRCTGYENIVKAVQYAAAKMRGEDPNAAVTSNGHGETPGEAYIEKVMDEDSSPQTAVNPGAAPMAG